MGRGTNRWLVVLVVPELIRKEKAYDIFFVMLSTIILVVPVWFVLKLIC